MSIRMYNDHVDYGHARDEEEEEEDSYPIEYPGQAEAGVEAETEIDRNETNSFQTRTPKPSRGSQAPGQAYIPYSSPSPSPRPLPQRPPDRNYDLGQVQVPNQAPKQAPSYMTYQPHRHNRSYDLTHANNSQERYQRRPGTSSGSIGQVRSVSPRKPVRSSQHITASQLPLPPNTTETDTELSSYASSQNTQITQPMTPPSPLPPVPPATSQSPLSQCHYQSDEEDRTGDMYREQPKPKQPPAYSKKFVVVGDGGCGKTCLLISYSQGYFPERYVPTVFENYITQTTHKSSGKSVELALWDTAGQEEYDRLRPLSYPETDLLFVCFSIDCPASLENVMDKWYPEVLHFCPSTPLILVGLKSDLRTKRTCIELLKTQGLTPVTVEQGQSVATRMGAMYIECSSKEMQNVEQIFELAVNVVVDVEEEELALANSGGNTFNRHSVFVPNQTSGLGSGAGNVTPDAYGAPARNAGPSVGVRGSTIVDRSARDSTFNSPAVARRATVAGPAKETASRTNNNSTEAKTKAERKTMGGKKIKKRQCLIL